jgi:hypothetical protein
MSFDGFVDEMSRDLVAGWAIDMDHPGQSVDVMISVNGRVATIVETSHSRLDVSERMKEVIKPELHSAITGSYGFAFSFDPPLSVFREQNVEVRFAATDELLGNGLKQLGVPKSGNTKISPLLVTAAGRSGSTLLMQRLARHPGIVIADRYPFEIKLISYYSRAYQVLISGEDRKRSSNPGTIVDDPYFIGFNPYNRPGYFAIAKDRRIMADFFERKVPQTLADAFGQLLLGYYGVLAADQGKAGARFFAEKASPNETVRQGARLFSRGARELLLIRDPRDIICSANAFWKVSRELGPVELAEELRRLQAAYDDNSDDTMLVRYEDLVTRSAEIIAAIHHFLGLPASSDLTNVPEDEALFSRHATSATPADSIGRWKTDMSRNEISICEREFGGFLARFGYV